MGTKPTVIDVSHWQGPIDFAKVKQDGILGVIMKATEGLSGIDASFAANSRLVGPAGLVWGTYHYLVAGTDADQQMHHYIDTVNPGVGSRVIIDFEDDGLTLDDLREAVQELLQISDDLNLNLQITVYSGHLLKEQLADGYDALLANYTSLWVAQYTDASEPSWPKATYPVWSLWQYSDNGTIAGVDGPVDLNRFNGSDENLLSWLGPASAPQPVPPEETVASIVVDISSDKDVKLTVNLSGNIQATVSGGAVAAEAASGTQSAPSAGESNDDDGAHDGWDKKDEHPRTKPEPAAPPAPEEPPVEEPPPPEPTTTPPPSSGGLTFQ